MKTKCFRSITSAILAFGAVSLSVLPGNTATLKEIQERGYIRAAIHNEPPYAYITPDGTPKGLGPEVATVLLNRLGIKEIDWVVTPFSTLIPGLRADRWDMVASQQTINPERCAVVSFANPMSAVGETLLVKAGNPKNLHSYDDVKKDPSVKVTIQSGSIESTYFQAYGVNPDQILLIPNASDAADTMLAGRADAYAAEDASAAMLLHSGAVPGFELAEPFTQPLVNGKPVTSYASHTFRQEDNELREAYDKELAEFMKTPEFADIVKRNGLPATSTERALTQTAEQRCAAK